MSENGPGPKPGENETITGTPSELEQQIQMRRERLAATIDELSGRAHPKAIAQQGAALVSARVQSVTHTPEGELRTERLAAVAGAFVVLAGVLIFSRSRG
ncbi:DUF3618 domain-containing protein [Kineosporia babensis]|uniref:DUF3618 domain-containing protein n=1 Tax=Kineosporia babensis TaxID=499548 RepID=A0A9X1NHY7_9ACTN|nr:DUF3618 domain-containing protein [Kineosporia babensis]MCD5313443.1 DUF3618 domain-containing protein [Kineosporia babensis]